MYFYGVSYCQITNNYYDYRDMVQIATWYLGGPPTDSNTTYYPDEVYNVETNSNYVCSGNSNSVTANVGLIYTSDYG